MLDFASVRQETVRICSGLETEDYVVQPHDFVSPPKWHLGHTTWLFETFALRDVFQMQAYREDFHYLFNSYYESLGDHELQGRRGFRSRPTVREVLAYRDNVDGRMREAQDTISRCDARTQIRFEETLKVGLHHEQQHQELLYMDIKNILFHQPGYPGLKDAPIENTVQVVPHQWKEVQSGAYEIGAHADAFAYDNEFPRHRVWLEDFRMRRELVTNREFQCFIDDGGYTRPELWLADGWNWVEANRIAAPLYWTKPNHLFTLQGEKPMAMDAPVAHVSYFEADAFARWMKCRLPTEVEWEVACADESCGPLWQWTQSAYLPYPGFKPFPGALMEYNGKFMSGGQMVLRGGCSATPLGHYRPSYRNFFYPQMRWMFSGICLCV